MLALPAPTATDVIARAAVVEGYNSNTYQAQDNPSVPIIERHPSPFTGIDASLELRFLGRDADRTTLLVGGRLNHYTPLQHEIQSDDGAVNGLFTSRLTLAPRTVLAINEAFSVTSFNASHTTDGTMFTFDPTQIRSTYWLDDFNAQLTYEISPNWRLVQSLGATLSGTISSAPVVVPGGFLVEHRGLDYIMPYVETDVNHTLTARSQVDLAAMYQYAYQIFVLDLTQTPARDIGPDKTAFLTLLGGYTYNFNPELTGVVRAGGVLSSAPPRDTDQRAVLSPAGAAEVYYTRDFFNVIAAGSYTWGTVNPRLGSGPTANASLLAVGVPYHVGRWKDLALLGTVQVSLSQLKTGDDSDSTKLGLYAAGIEVRYGLSGWLGLVGGYNIRYATFDTPTWEPPFIQQIGYFGFGGYFSTDKVQLPLVNFAAPVQPPA
jgi:hypothetical protein